MLKTVYIKNTLLAHFWAKLSFCCFASAAEGWDETRKKSILPKISEQIC